jgi:hypothetical protein
LSMFASAATIPSHQQHTWKSNQVAKWKTSLPKKWILGNSARWSLAKTREKPCTISATEVHKRCTFQNTSNHDLLLHVWDCSLDHIHDDSNIQCPSKNKIKIYHKLKYL